MRQYFADTWFLIARFDRTDSDHSSALSIDRRIGQTLLVSHDRGLTHALTNDHHFHQEGFVVVNE